MPKTYNNQILHALPLGKLPIAGKTDKAGYGRKLCYARNLEPSTTMREILTYDTDLWSQFLSYVSIYFLYVFQLNFEKNNNIRLFLLFNFLLLGPFTMHVIYNC